MACVRWVTPGGKVRKRVREFKTMTGDLLALADWLQSHQVPLVAMESTGVYWKPIWNLLEGQFELWLCNARDVKQVPGRKTDAKDAEWLAQLLQHGLLRPSFVPDRPQRELRELTRQRAQFIGDRTAVINRIQKVLEDANVKLSTVATELLGASGRAMLEAIIAGESAPQALAALARGTLKKKYAQLVQALEGRITDHHRFLLRELYDHLVHQEQLIARFDERIAQQLATQALSPAAAAEEPLPFDAAVEYLRTVPGIDQRSAENILAEIGTDMSRFPSAQHLASWAGMCPGNHQSAGKRKSGRTTDGNRWLRRALTQAAWAATRKKDSYLAAQYRRLSSRRGKKRAIVAVGHTLLTAAYYILRDHTTYTDLGPDHFQQLHPERLKQYLVKRLQSLGFAVTLTTQPEAA